MKMRLPAALSLALFMSANAVAQNRFGTEGERVQAQSDFAWSALSILNGQPQCSPWIVEHGVLATAKHCFILPGLSEAQAKRSNLTVIFSKSGQLAPWMRPDIVLQGNDIKDVIYDSGDNDIAYILYDKRKTEGVIPLDNKIVYDAPPKNTPLNLVGFPKPAPYLTRLCRAHGRTPARGKIRRRSL